MNERPPLRALLALLGVLVVAVVSALLIIDFAVDAGNDAADAPRAGEPREARTIRGWSAALNAGDFDRAADYFAPGAIVDQGRPIRLPDHRAAVFFNRTLPCRGEVTEVEDEGETILARFRLLPGRDGGCAQGGRARVRFRISGGRFLEWRQLPDPGSPPGEIA